MNCITLDFLLKVVNYNTHEKFSLSRQSFHGMLLQKIHGGQGHEERILLFHLHLSMGIKRIIYGLSWWLSSKESTYQCRWHGFSPWSRKIPTSCGAIKTCVPQLESQFSRAWMLQLLSPCATATKLCALKAPAPQQEKPPQRDARTSQLEKNPCSHEDPTQPTTPTKNLF